MKLVKYLSGLFLFLLPMLLNAQTVPGAFSYQAVVRDAMGTPMTSSVDLRFQYS